MEVIASPNHGERRDGGRPRLLVLHYTAMGGGADPVIRHFCKPEIELSAHYVIGRLGRVIRMVPEERRAWHAGAGHWGDITDVNSNSIGVEICNDGDQPFAAPQMDAVERLVADIVARHRIPSEGVIGHSDCAPGRKIDPGPRFDWRRLARQGLGVWPTLRDAGPADSQRFRADLGRFGYCADLPDTVLLEAFRLRFRPRRTGPLDTVDMGLAADLAARWPHGGVDVA